MLLVKGIVFAILFIFNSFCLLQRLHFCTFFFISLHTEKLNKKICHKIH